MKTSSNTIEIKYPKIRDRLLLLLAEDQKELSLLTKKFASLDDLGSKREAIKPVAEQCQQRMVEVIEIMKKIELPLHSYIDVDGSEAIVVLALHSHVDQMRYVLRQYNKAFTLHPTEIDPTLIPLLTDRISIIESREQQYGTMWLEDTSGKYFLVPVKNFRSVNTKRKKYGLGPISHPTQKNQKGSERLATAEDQKAIPKDIYDLNFAYMDVNLLNR